MKKMEYAGLQVPDSEDKQLELASSKGDESRLPQFSKHVPASSRKSEHGESMTKEYSWKKSECSQILVKKITFRKSENLQSLYRIESRDGIDTVSLSTNNAVYVFRRTTKEIAKALYNTYSSMREGLENIVGWLQTVLGNSYVISKVERTGWTFDKRLTKNDQLNYSDPDSLDDCQKKALTDLIIQNLATLHSKGLVLGRFTLNSVLLLNEELKFTDLRGLRKSRKLSYGVEEFKSVMQYLFALGLVSGEDQYYSVAMYHTLNEEACNSWYEKCTGKKPAEPVDVTDHMESEIF